jgi:hypothetical protein
MPLEPLEVCYTFCKSVTPGRQDGPALRGAFIGVTYYIDREYCWERNHVEKFTEKFIRRKFC